jgi:NAD(P)-dependent dehydrogenase (short-subunit alcohol dehydrogenase family)
MADTMTGGVAVITGAASGIGLGIARAAAAAGMKLVLADIAVDALADVARTFVDQGHETLALPTDVADPEALDRLAEATQERFGSVRLLVNNAGIETLGKIWELSAEQWERALRINVLGAVNGVRAFAPAMIAAGKPAFISTVASIGALGMAPGQTPYIVSKHAMLAFSEGLFLEMEEAAPHIAVSVVLPGPVRTRIFADAPAADIGEPTDQYRAQMDDIISTHGLHPDEAGRMIFDQISDGRFWVTTHPAMLEASVKSRADYLTGLVSPAQRKKMATE